MESQPENPEFRNNPENFHACVCEKQRLWQDCADAIIAKILCAGPFVKKIWIY